MRRAAVLAVAPVLATLVYVAFASTTIRKWWTCHRQDAETNNYRGEAMSGATEEARTWGPRLD
jgi:hypothetical protein